MITGIIMASGFSKRMGENKLLVEVEGTKLIERVIESCKKSILDEIILIYRLDEVKDIGNKHGIKTIFNPNANLGQSAAVILGVENSKDSDAYMFIVGDQPYLDPLVINRLIEEYRKDKKMIVVPYYNFEFGMPIVFPKYYKDQLLKVKGDKGGNEIIRNTKELVKKIHFKNELLGVDIDTLEDLDRIINR